MSFYDFEFGVTRHTKVGEEEPEFSSKEEEETAQKVWHLFKDREEDEEQQQPQRHLEEHFREEMERRKTAFDRKRYIFINQV